MRDGEVRVAAGFGKTEGLRCQASAGLRVSVLFPKASSPLPLARFSVHLAGVPGEMGEMIMMYFVVQVADLPAGFAEILVSVVFEIGMLAFPLPDLEIAGPVGGFGNGIFLVGIHKAPPNFSMQLIIPRRFWQIRSKKIPSDPYDKSALNKSPQIPMINWLNFRIPLAKELVS
jgi:hypothetical protein